MSKKNNVNPDFYKLAGRGRPSEIAPVREAAGRRETRANRRPGKASPGGPTARPAPKPGSVSASKPASGSTSKASGSSGASGKRRKPRS